MITALCSEQIASLGNNLSCKITLQVVPETGSTNADLKLALPELSGPTLLIAEKQTAGRGRAGRVWHAIPGASLTFSLAWPFALPLQALVGLPLVVGVAIADALAEFGVEVQLKWPNDVLLDGKKLAGVLIETATTATSAPASVSLVGVVRSWAIIGIGMNLVADEELAQRIGQPIASAPELVQMDRNLIVAILLEKLSDALMFFEQRGLNGFLARWNALHAYNGKPVRITDSERLLHEGVARGVDTTGCLLLDTPTGQVTVASGDVSLRLQHVLPDTLRDISRDA